MIPAGLSSTSFRWIPTAFRFVTIPWTFAIRGSVVAFRWRNARVKGAPAGVSRQPSPSRSKYPARSSRSFTLSRIVTTRPWSTPLCTRYWGTETLNQNAFAGVTTESAMSIDGSICRISSRSSAVAGRPAPPVDRVRGNREGHPGNGRAEGEEAARLRGPRRGRVRDREGAPLPEEVAPAAGEREPRGRGVHDGDGEPREEARGQVSLIRRHDGVRGERGGVRELRV